MDEMKRGEARLQPKRNGEKLKKKKKVQQIKMKIMDKVKFYIK